MAELKDYNNPSFVLFPVNNNRTAWRPYGLPAILVVPHKRTPSGAGIENSQVFNVRIFIEDVPKEARVAGHQNIGVRFPDRELYAETIDSIELADRTIDLSNVQITSAATGETVSLDDAKTGDIITYTTVTGVTDTLEYLVGATYYDLSDILIEMELLPSDVYNLIYQAEYFTRVISKDERQDFLCIDPTSIGLAILRFEILHPGPIMDEFYRLTPPPYLTNSTKALDTTVDLYRPFTDSLQDISDEQELLESVNWVFKVPAEAIPYLSQLLGWDLPYFPESLDRLRRAVLRRTVEFQNLAGSRRAIINIFRLFGFEILISNLWWSADGKRFIRPGERLPSPYQDEEIEVEEQCQTDLLLDAWQGEPGTISRPTGSHSGFGVFRIPLMARPQEEAGLDDFESVRDGGNLSIDVYFVEVGSPAEQQLKEISQEIKSDPTNYGHENGCTEDNDGFLNPTDIHGRLSGLEVVGYSQVLVTGKLGKGTDEIIVGPEIPLRKEGVSFDRETNNLDISLNGALDVTGTDTPRVLYAFTTYKKRTLIVPDALTYLQSNRFDIQVLTETLNDFADPVTLEFAIEFLFKLKAFHSLLNRVVLRIGLTETYEVTDLCVGGDVEQRYDTDIGMLQVPPAIIPDLPQDLNDCTRLDPESLGYKDEDIILRLRKLDNLPEEHLAWKILDDRDTQSTSSERLNLQQPAPGRDECKFTHHGQDRIISGRTESRDTQFGPSPNAGNGDAGFSKNPDISPADIAIGGDYDETGAAASTNSDSSPYGSFTREFTEIRTPFCELDGLTDHCYKGRVDDELLYRPTVINDEWWRCKPCSISMGYGVYWTFPSISVMSSPGTARPCPTSKSQKPIFSGNAPSAGVMHFLDGIQNQYLTAPYTQSLPAKNDSYLGRLYRDYDTPRVQTLHFSNRPEGVQSDQQLSLALERPSLNIDKSTLHLPGCRFIRMNALEADFSSTIWRARPWDDPHSTYCGPAYPCGDEPTFLNVTKIIGTDNNEYLVFDDVPYTAIGNGLVPDVPSLGDHILGLDALFAEIDVIHSVYMKNADESPYMTLEQVCDYDTAVTIQTDGDGEIETNNPLFTSHSECNNTALILVDYADGYACVSGNQPYSGEDLGQGVYDDVLDALGVPGLGTTDQPSELLFQCGSGILDPPSVNDPDLGVGGYALRLDCGCLLISCDSTEAAPGDSICSADIFVDENGEYDWDCDHLLVETRLIGEELIGTCSHQLTGEIPSLLETV
jgi:hypothetical protein